MTVGGLRLQALLQQQLPVILKSRLEAALGRPVQFGALHVTPTGMWVDELRVIRAPHEIDDPLTAHHLRVSLDWWSLLTARQVQVHGVDMEGARLVVGPSNGGTSAPWTDQVLSLSRAGISHLGLRNAAIRVAGRSGQPDAWSASGIHGDLDVTNADFYYTGRAASWTGASITLAGLHVSGSGDRESLRLNDAGAVYQGGRFEANGTVGVTQSAAELSVRVKDMALSRLAGQIGIPADWAMMGRVTGDVRVDAHNGALRGVCGKVRVDRGSVTRDGSRLPWKQATADLDWTPRGASLANVKVSGPGLELTAAGDVKTAPGQPFTSGAFQVKGAVQATGAPSVARVSELLAFQRILNGRWTAADAEIQFDASGVVGKLAQATANGKLRVDNVEFRQQPGSQPIRISRLEAEARRTTHQLALSHLVAQTDGLTVHSDLTLGDDRSGQPAQLSATGSVEVKDLKSLRAALPDAALWKWVPAMMPTANGSLQFKLGGPVADPSHLLAEGSFEARNFRLGGHSALPNGAMFFVPIKDARGTFRHTAGELSVSNLELEAPTFHATGGMQIGFHGEPTVNSRLHFVTDDWRSLPAVPPTALAELSGGHFEADLAFESALDRLSQVPLTGSFTLRDAAYTPRGTTRAIPMRSLGAQFRWADGTLDLPELALDSALLQATAHGRMTSANGDYQLALDLDAKTPDAGSLSAAYASNLGLTSGAGSAQLHLQGPLSRLSAAAVTGKVQLADAKLAREVAVLGLHELDAKELVAQFSGHDQSWNLSDLTVKSSQYVLSLRGALEGARVDGDVKFQLAQWNAPASLPLTGGAITLTGKLQGDVNHLQAAAFNGDVEVHGATPRYAGKNVALKGGKLTLAAHGEGALSDAAKWLRSGNLELAGAELTTGRQTRRIARASAQVTRDGDGFRFTDAHLSGEGLTADGGGTWSPNGHHLQVVADAADLSKLGVKLPDGFQAGHVRLEGTIEGNAETVVRSAEGTVQAQNGRILLAGTSPQDLTSLLGAFHYTPEGLRIDRLEGQGPAGAFTASGNWSASGQGLQLTAEGTDFSRLGMALPEGFHVGPYQLTASLTGTAEHPLSTGSGTLELRDARYPFGPGAAHRLDRVTSRFALDRSGTTLQDLVAIGPEGRFTGSGSVRGEQFELALASAKLDPQFAAWLLPGTVKNGQLSGTLNLNGSVKAGLQNVGGHFNLADAKYTLPAGSGAEQRPVQVAQLAADYRWNGGRTTLQNLALRSDLMNGSGSLNLGVEGTHLAANLTAASLGEVANLWPTLRGMLKGGSGEVKVDSTWTADGARGSLQLAQNGGTLVLPNMPAEFAEQPVDHATVALLFQPGQLSVKDVQVRGPKGNLDGSGVLSADGTLSGTGTAWFTKKYTSGLLPKGFAGFMARLMGVKELKSDFTLTGNTDKVTLNAGITKSWLWKYAKARVPKEFQPVAAGKSPLWEKSAAVAENAPAPIPEK